MNRLTLVCVLISLIAGNLCTEQSFTERFHWSPVAFDLQSLTPQQRQEVDKAGPHARYNDMAIFGAQFSKDDKLFVCTQVDKPEKNTTIPLVLGQVDVGTKNQDNKSPPIIPFAVDELMNQALSTSYMEIDVCDRLWFVDFLQMRLFVINVKDGKKIRDVNLNIAVAKVFGSVTVDVQVNSESGQYECDNTYAYIPHPNRFQIVVYRFNDNAQWNTNLPSFSFQNLNFTFAERITKGIEEGTDKNGILATTLSESTGEGKNNRILYGANPQAPVLFSIPTKTLQNPPEKPEFTVHGWIGFATPSIYYHKQSSTIFYNRLGDNLLGCWNAKKYPQGVTLETTDAIKVPGVTLKNVYTLFDDSNDNLWLNEVTQVDKNDKSKGYGSRLLSASISDLTKNTRCQA